MEGNKLLKGISASVAAVATFVGVGSLVSKITSKNDEKKFFAGHPENGGLGLDSFAHIPGLAEDFAQDEPVSAAPAKHAGDAEEAPVTMTQTGSSMPAEASTAPEEAPYRAENETVPVKKPAPKRARTVQIGDTEVSDDPANDIIRKVVDATAVNADQMVSLEADNAMPMVLLFKEGKEKNAMNLEYIYFLTPEGKVSIPPKSEQDNIVEFGRAFITKSRDLQNFIAES